MLFIKSENYLLIKCVVVLKCFYKKDGHVVHRELTIVGSYKHIFVYVHVGNIYNIFQSICNLDTIKLYFIQTRRQAHCINVSVS